MEDDIGTQSVVVKGKGRMEGRIGSAGHLGFYVVQLYTPYPDELNLPL